MSRNTRDKQSLKNILDFLANAPENETIIKMDCNEHCEELGALAERVASGEDLCNILPELEEHMKYWGDCREEFEALVAILKAELEGSLPDLPAADNPEP